MGEHDKLFKRLLDNLHSEQRYRVFRCLERSYRDSADVDWHLNPISSGAHEKRKITVWCSNDYLGMSQHPEVLAAAHEAVEKWGVGSGGTRNISGTHLAIVELEKSLASAVGKESALVFSSGYNANETALSTLGRVLEGCIFYSDSENHASMIEGMRLTKARKVVFRHNDLSHLEELLAEAPSGATKVVAFESVYSMSGDFGAIEGVARLAKRYGAITYLDETHGVGIYGQRGGGVAQQLGLTGLIDIIQGGLGKGYGVVGGFIAASSDLIDVIRSYGSGFIFTTSIPPMVAWAAKASVDFLSRDNSRRSEHQAIVSQTRSALGEHNLSVKNTTSHILPFQVGCSASCTKLSEFLLNEFGVYLQPINYPTVGRGEEMLRITPTPLHSQENVRTLVAGLCKAAELFEQQGVRLYADNSHSTLQDAQNDLEQSSSCLHHQHQPIQSPLAELGYPAQS